MGFDDISFIVQLIFTGILFPLSKMCLPTKKVKFDLLYYSPFSEFYTLFFFIFDR